MTATPETTERIELGLALLSVARRPGAAFTRDDIAAWCDCSREAIRLLEEAALKRCRDASRFGQRRGQGEEIGRSQKLTPDQARRAAARTWRKSSHGGAAIPGYVVSAMYAEYLRLGSLRKAAATFYRTKQDLAYIFHQRRLQVRGRGGPNRRKAA